jgi:hypothetical protein
LTNGNIVFVFPSSAGTTLYFQIVTPTGTAVANGTISSSFTATFGGYCRAYSVCALNSGGFAVAFNNSSTVYSATYTSTGTVVRAVTNTSIASVTGASYYPRIIANSSDTIFISTTSYPSPGAGGTAYISALNSSGAYIASINVSASAYCSTAIEIVVLSAGNIAWIYGSPDYVNTYYFGIVTWSGSAFVSLNESSGGTPSGSLPSNPPKPIALYNGYVAWVTPLSGSNYFTVYIRTASNSNIGSVNSSSSTYAYPSMFGTVPYWGAASSTATSYTANSNSFIYYTQNSGATGVSAYLISFTGTSTISIGSATSTSLPNYGGGSNWCWAPTFTAGNVVGYIKSTDSKPYFQSVGNFTLTNGTSYSVPSLYSSLNPVTNYYLVGVAMTTASASSYGDVMINGTASLSSSYGTSSTPVGFNYNAANNPNLFSNRGSVVNRVVTLQGLE